MKPWAVLQDLPSWTLQRGALVLLAVFVGLLTWLYSGSEAVSPEQHFAYTQDLRDLRELNTHIEVELLAAQLGQVRNYDAVTDYLRQGLETARRTRTVPAYLSQGDSAQLAQAAGALQKTLEQVAELVDRFKRNHAVLQNALTLFPLLTTEFLTPGRQPALPAGVRTAAEAYAREVLVIAHRHDLQHLRDVALARQRLTSMVLNTGQRHAVDLIVRHGEMVEVRLAAMERLMMDLSELQADRDIDHLSLTYFSGYRQALAVAERFLVSLYVATVLLTAFLALLFVRLERIRRSLAFANREINDRYQAQLMAEKHLTLHATAFASAHDGITLTDAQGNILDVNPSFARITGWQRSEVIGRNPRVLKSGRHDQAFYAALWKSIAETGNWQGEIWNRNKFGEVYPELLSISAVHDAAGALTNYVAVFSDIGRLKAQESQLKQLAYFDALTGLPNRVLLGDRLLQGIAQALRANTLMAVCYLDLDGFKAINDAWGHETGDRVLVEMSNRMKLAMRGGDTVARLGGDEFVVLLMGLDTVSECHEAVTRLLAQIALPLTLLSEPLSVTGSAGVALFPLDDQDPDTLLRHADQAMYRSKMAGKNKVHVFDAEEDRSARNRYDHVSRIRLALEDGEFVLHYQPQVNMRLGQVTGVEALIRWNHPQRGLVPPVEFLSLIEADELIVEVGDWVIATALQQMKAWHDAGLTLAVSVNVAGRQLQAPDFTQKLRTLCAREPELTRRLELEILETSALEDIVKTTRVIEECQQLGLSFSLDDFGTGYSSLTYLRRLPARAIKIDQSFVREILNDHNNLLIVQAVIGLAGAFQLHVIAEGVETADQGRMLMQLNCDHAQGYFVAKPMAAEAVPDWVAHWAPDPGWQAIRDLYWSDADYLILIAEVRFRNWFNQLLRESAAPQMHLEDIRASGLVAWYQGPDRHRFGPFPSYALLGHSLAQLEWQCTLRAEQRRGGQGQALHAQVPVLRQIRDDILAALHALQMAVAVRAVPGTRPSAPSAGR
jgi:diguanylate cyclase (GGDEF)-like protein/PAS domain S-box-containing protein